MATTEAATEGVRFDEPARRAAARVLWAIAQVPAADPAEVAAAVDGAGDPTLWAGAALAQRLGPLLWRALAAADALDALGPHREVVEREHMVRHAQAALLLPRALELAIRPLEDAGFAPVVFKGPAVARRYPEPGLRPMDDIDVLLPRDQSEPGIRTLERAGWARWVDRDPGHHHEEVLTHRALPGLALELHHDLATWQARGNRLRLQHLVDGAVRADCLGVDCLVPAPEVDLVGLAAHAGKPFHHFGRLLWIVDLAVLLQDEPGFDWDRVRAIATETRCRTVVAVALRLATRLGATPPDDLLVLPRNRDRRATIDHVLDEVWPAAEPSERVDRWLRYAVWDDRWRKLLLAAAASGAGGWREAPAEAVRHVRGYARRLAGSRGRA